MVPFEGRENVSQEKGGRHESKKGMTVNTESVPGKYAAPHDDTIKVLLADDAPVMLLTLSRLLAKQALPVIVATAADGWLALRAALESTSDLVLLDLHLPRLDT